MKLKDDFIPVLVYENGRMVYWYLDVSKLSLGKLTQLRNELKLSNSIAYIDKIITSNTPSGFNYYNDNRKYRKELKTEKQMKRKTKHKRRRR